MAYLSRTLRPTVGAPVPRGGAEPLLSWIGDCVGGEAGANLLRRCVLGLAIDEWNTASALCGHTGHVAGGPD